MEPGELALGKLAGADFDEFDGVGEAAGAAEMFNDLAVTDGLQGGGIFREAA